MTPSIQADRETVDQLREELDSRILRIAFTTGCGGSGYRLASADGPVEGDVTIEVNGLTIALDDMAAKELDGARIVSDGDGYSLDHPAAALAVWCG